RRTKGTSMTNHITIEGRLTDDPEMRYLDDGRAMARFDLAHNTRRKNAAGEWEDGESTFIPVTCWRHVAEAVAELGKGTIAVVVGRLRQERWEHDGQKRSRLSVVAESVSRKALPPKRDTSPAQRDSWGGGATD